MADIQTSTRLGDLLVERRIISANQLREAIELQQSRRIDGGTAPGHRHNNELGEILIELGFIGRSELKASLSWQRKLRKTTAVMVFIAPLLTAACGGGGGGGSSSASPVAQSTSVSSQPLVQSTPQDKPETVQSSVSSVALSSAPSQPVPVASVADSSSSAISSSSSSNSSSSAASSAAPVAKTGVLDGAVQLYWEIPTERENGSRLDITEIAGYDVRYKLKTETSYQYITINDAYTDAFYFDYLQGEYEFQIATFDINNVYSKFVNINPY